MGNDGRKHLRVAIPAADYADFVAAKVAAESSAMVLLTDPQFAVKLIQWALKEKSKSND